MKRFLSLLVGLALVLSLMPAVSAVQADTVLTAEQESQILSQRRDMAEAHMRKITSMIWRCEQDVLFAVPDSVWPEKASENFYLVAGRLYQGLPYSFSGGSYGSWMELVDGPDANGVYTVPELNWQMISGGGGTARFGTDCSGAVTQAWSQIGASIRLQATKDMCPKYGYLRIGDYTASYDKIDDAEIKALDPQVMYAAYAKLQKADALVHNGHVRMAVSVDVVKNSDGTINGAESTVTYLEQTRQLMREDIHHYDAELGEDVWELCGVDLKISFETLYTYSYQPITCLELIDASAGPEAPKVKDSLSPSEYGFDTLLSGTLTTGTWVMDTVEMTITSTAGKVIQSGMITAPRGGVGTRYKVPMSMFMTEAPTRMLGYISPDNLLPGDYHCKVVCRLTTGQKFTVRDFDFTVTATKNDIHKKKIDFTLGTVHDCPMCGEKNAQWMPLTTDYVGSGKGPKTGHYYLPESMENNASYISTSGQTVCLHLNGKNITSKMQALSVSTTNNVKGVLNVMGDGIVTGTKPTTGYFGAALQVSGGTANLYGGTYRHNRNTDTSDTTQRPVIGLRNNSTINLYNGAKVEGDPNVKRPNVLIFYGRINMYGGEVVNGYGTNGGNFLVGYDNSTYCPNYLCVYGGKIANGTATGFGGNIYAVYDSAVYLYDGQVLGGTAPKGNNLAVNAGGNIHISGGVVSGDSGISIYGSNSTRKYTSKTEIDESTGALLVQNLYMKDCGVQIGENAHVEGEFYTEKNAFVADPYQKTLLRLPGDLQQLTLQKDMQLDLNGFSVQKLVTDNHRLTVLDSTTDDFDAESYGTIPSEVSYQPAENYLETTEGERVSFHKYALQISEVTLKTSKSGLSYNCFIAGDQKVKEQVSEFGVVMKVYNPATAQDLIFGSSNKPYAWCDGSQWQIGRQGQKLISVAVTHILNPELTAAENQKRANIPVYGSAYMVLKSGKCLFGEAACRTMQQVTEEVDSIYTQLETAQKQALQTLFNTHKNIMDQWKIPNIQSNR